MATIAQIQAAIDAWMLSNQQKFVRRQDKYFPVNRRYFQGIMTPAVAPDDGAVIALDWDKKPTDQIESWRDVFVNDADGNDVLPANGPVQIRMDSYHSPFGHGWLIALQGTKDEVLWFRTWNFGPETWRETGWLSVPVV